VLHAKIKSSTNVLQDQDLEKLMPLKNSHFKSCSTFVALPQSEFIDCNASILYYAFLIIQIEKEASGVLKNPNKQILIMKILLHHVRSLNVHFFCLGLNGPNPGSKQGIAGQNLKACVGVEALDVHGLNKMK
jgi:hypothetical protein